MAGFKNGKITRKGKGCPKCGRIITLAASIKTFDTFLKEARTIHGDLYEYDPDSYKGVKTKMNIYCYKHGWFIQRPDEHINAKHGCYLCGKVRASLLMRLSKKELLRKIKSVHGNTYTYDLTNYLVVFDKIRIKCKIHGWFLQTAYDHYYNKTGCPKCKSSHGEREVRKILNHKNIIFEEQYKIPECKNIRKLPFDFAVLSNKGFLKGLIEYHGQLHTKKIDHFERTKEDYLRRNLRDQIKSDFCELNKIPLLVIYYSDFDKIDNLINVFCRKIRNKKPVMKFLHPNQLNIFQF